MDPLTGAPQQDLESLLVTVAAIAITAVALWYLLAALALLRASRSGSRTLRMRVARWGPPILKGIAAAGLASSFIAPASADTDFSWGAPLPSPSTIYEPPPAEPTPAAPARDTPPAAPAATTVTTLHDTGQAGLMPRTHTVVAGDCLWSIARAYYAPTDDSEMADLVLDLYLANKGVIGNDPNLIHPGQTITLP